jgi:hypothetical protein
LFSELRDAANADPLENPENLDWGKSLHQVGEVKTLGDRPAIVITAGSTFAGGAEILFPVWKRLQNELANLSSATVHVLAPTSTHYVQNDAPDVVLASVRAVVTALRDKGELAACAAIFRQDDDAKCLPG